MPWAQLAVGALQLVKSESDKAQTKNEAKLLGETRPKIGRDANADANLALVKSELANGMSARAEQAYKDIDQANFSSTLSSLLKGGGDVNSVGDIYGNSQEGAMKLSLIQDSLRANQIKNVIDQSNYVDSRNTITPFQVNENAPWSDSAAANGVARGQAAKQGNDALQTFTSALMQYGQNAQEQKMLRLKTNSFTDNTQPTNSGFDTSSLVSTPSTYTPTRATDISGTLTVQPTFKPTSIDQVVTTSNRPSFLDNSTNGDYDKWKNIWNEINFKKY